MDLQRYIGILPSEVLEHGTFCVTRVRDKKPYDPFKRTVIGAKDEFYDILSLLDLDLSEYDTLGIKIIDPISTIDIDNCVVDGKANDMALDIIHMLKSYTEISPSGTGIRILFRALNHFDRDEYKIKNSKNGVEYYDAIDQQSKGGRMVRLSGNQIFPEYEFRAVDTTKMLNIYMRRELINFDVENEDGEINKDKCYFIGEAIKKDYSIYDIYYRHMTRLSESEWDLMLLNYINFYTRNINEVRYIFENSTYFKTKKNEPPKYHVNKWFNTGYAERVLPIVRPSLGNSSLKKYVNLFEDTEYDETYPLHYDLLVNIAVEIGFVKFTYFPDAIKVDVKSFPEEAIVAHCMWIAKNRVGIIKTIRELNK